jgi:hypothetical protein
MAQKSSTVDLIQQWTEINQNFWSNWLNSTRHLGKGPAGIDEAYHEQLKGLENVVEGTMRLEKDWMKMTREQASQNQAAEPAVKVMTDFAESALDTRRQLWKAVFDNAQSVDLSSPAGALGAAKGPQEFLAAMRESAERLMGAQASTAKAAANAAESAQAAVSDAPAASGQGTQGTKKTKTG